jgi:hypothetical protein
MALLHKAEIRPNKIELLAAWLPSQSWYAGPAEPLLERVAAGRFDDPAGEVGLEVMLVDAGDGVVLHTPLTYRAAPLDEAEEFLVGTTEHSVLGKRWVYDAAGDPVFAAVLAEVIRTGGTQAAEEVHDGQGGVVVREPHLLLRGSGVVTPGDRKPDILRTPSAPPTPGAAVLTAQWSGVDTPVVLATLTT